MIVTLFVSTEKPLSAAVMSLATIKSRFFDSIFVLLFSTRFSLSAAKPTFISLLEFIPATMSGFLTSSKDQ